MMDDDTLYTNVKDGDRYPLHIVTCEECGCRYNRRKGYKDRCPGCNSLVAKIHVGNHHFGTPMSQLQYDGDWPYW